MADPIEIMLISGSLRDMSGNSAVLRTAIELARLAEPLGVVSTIEDYRLRAAGP